MKKALKRLSSLVVCGTLSLTLFAGCSGSSSDTSSTAAGSAPRCREAHPLQQAEAKRSKSSSRALSWCIGPTGRLPSRRAW